MRKGGTHDDFIRIIKVCALKAGSLDVEDKQGIVGLLCLELGCLERAERRIWGEEGVAHGGRRGVRAEDWGERKESIGAFEEARCDCEGRRKEENTPNCKITYTTRSREHTTS